MRPRKRGRMLECVLDASAVLALMFQEPGQEIVAAHRPGAIVSAVNLGEVLTQLVHRGKSVDEALALVAALRLTTVDHTAVQAAICALLRPLTQHLGLSYGDRACLSLGIQQHRLVLTADRSWRDLSVGVEIYVIR